MFVFCAAIVAAESGFSVGAMYNHGVEFVQAAVAVGLARGEVKLSCGQ